MWILRSDLPLREPSSGNEMPEVRRDDRSHRFGRRRHVGQEIGPLLRDASCWWVHLCVGRVGRVGAAEERVFRLRIRIQRVQPSRATVSRPVAPVEPHQRRMWSVRRPQPGGGTGGGTVVSYRDGLPAYRAGGRDLCLHQRIDLIGHRRQPGACCMCADHRRDSAHGIRAAAKCAPHSTSAGPHRSAPRFPCPGVIRRAWCATPPAGC